MKTELALWTKKILILLGFLAGIYLLYTLSSLVLVLMISGFITILVNPLVEKGEQHKIPVWLTVTGVYILIFILGSIVIGTLIPIVIGYVSDTVTIITNWVNTAQSIYISEGIRGFHFHPYIEKTIVLMFGENNIEHTLDIIKQNAGNIQSVITKQISSVTSGGISVVSALGGVVANWAFVGIMAFLMILERKAIGKFILEIAPNTVHDYLRKHYHTVQDVCTTWIKATLVLSLSIFAVTYIGLHSLELILNTESLGTFFGISEFTIDKKFTLALIGGIMEFIPYVGPLIALIPAAIIGLGISWKVALGIVALYLLIQRLENDFLVPYVMSKALDLSPLLVFIVMIAGGTLGGVLGIILAIPIAGVLSLILKEHLSDKSKMSPGKRRTRTTPTPRKKIQTVIPKK